MSVLEVKLSDYSDLVEIGRGSSGTVYRARQPAFNRDVAIKLLHADAGPAALDRFAHECASIGALSGHPNIVTVYGLGMADDGRPFIVMELLPGGSLADRLAEDGPLEWPEVVVIGVKLAGTLESAHQAGVLHCDIKPANVLFSRYGELRLVDFGVARMLEAADHGPAGFPGTPAHAAPEILEGGHPTISSEVYSLASLLVTMLTGRSPSARPGASSLVRFAAGATVGEGACIPQMDVPDQLRTVLEGALARDPDARPDAARFGRQLQAVQAAHELGITPLPVESNATPGDASLLPTRPSVRQGRARLWAAAVGVLAVGLTFAVVSSSGAERPELVPLFQDNFDGGQGWYEYDDDVASLGYESGQYRITVKQQHHDAISDTAFRGPTFGVPLTVLGDVTVEVSASIRAGEGLFGTTCRQANGASAYYAGLVGADGTARIARYENERLDILSAATVPPPDPVRPTRVRLDCLGESHTRLALFLDGRRVTTATDRNGLAPGSVGLMAATGTAHSAEVLFDDVRVLGLAVRRP